MGGAGCGTVDTAVFHRPESGATIFNGGCTDWAFGLKHDDPDVVRITRNVLDRLGAVD